MTRQVFIWGSCVSRDTFEFFPDDCELLGYVARQSLISCGNRVENVELVPVLTSRFQQRMSAGDLEGGALARIVGVRDEIDLLLLDLCDERLGVLEVEPGRYLTRSVERIMAGMDAEPAGDHRFLEFGSHQHVVAWLNSLQLLAVTLEREGLKDRTVVLAPDWAMEMSDGEPSPSSFGLTAREANQVFDLYYQALAELDFTIVGREVEVLTDANHKWGPAPFHYTPGSYRQLVGAILNAWSQPQVEVTN